MTHEQLRQQLERARDDFRRRLVRLDGDVTHRADPLTADEEDRAQQVENDEVAQRIEGETRMQLAQYERALARLEQGGYGTCERCGFPIEPARLAAVPQATRCASCAGALEA